MAERADTFNGIFRKSARAYFNGNLKTSNFDKLNPDRKYTKKYLDQMMEEAKASQGKEKK